MTPTHRWFLWAAAFLAGASGLGYLAVTFIPCLPDWNTKTPEWVGAIGAIAAFAGTIVIASTESWRRRRANIDLATVASAEILDRTTAYTATIEILKRELPEQASMDRETLQTYKGLLEKHVLWERDEIMPLTALPGKVAPRMQRIAARHGRLISNLELLKYASRPVTVNRLTEVVNADLKKTYADLLRCQKEMQHLLRALYSDDDYLI